MSHLLKKMMKRKQLKVNYKDLIGNFFNILSISTLILCMYQCKLSLSGDHAKTLGKKTFTDAKRNKYLEPDKYVANLIWNGEIVMAIFNFVSFIPRVPGQAGAQQLLISPTSWSTVTPCSASILKASLGMKLSTNTKEGLKEMYLDIKWMHYSLRTNRFFAASTSL